MCSHLFCYCQYKWQQHFSICYAIEISTWIVLCWVYTVRISILAYCPQQYYRMHVGHISKNVVLYLEIQFNFTLITWVLLFVPASLSIKAITTDITVAVLSIPPSECLDKTPASESSCVSANNWKVHFRIREHIIVKPRASHYEPSYVQTWTQSSRE